MYTVSSAPMIAVEKMPRPVVNDHGRSPCQRPAIGLWPVLRVSWRMVGHGAPACVGAAARAAGASTADASTAAASIAAARTAASAGPLDLALEDLARRSLGQLVQ